MVEIRRKAIYSLSLSLVALESYRRGWRGDTPLKDKNHSDMQELKQTETVEYFSMFCSNT